MPNNVHFCLCKVKKNQSNKQINKSINSIQNFDWINKASGPGEMIDWNLMDSAAMTEAWF